jgi:hypothetical protein
MTDNCKRVKRVIPTISGVVTFTDEWGNKSNFDIKWIKLYKLWKQGVIDPKEYMSKADLKPAVFVNKLTDYNNMLGLLKDSAEYKDLFEFLGGGL